MACHIAHHTSRLREQAVALVTQHVEALHPGSHALLNCGPVRVISAVAVAVDVSGTLVADVYLEPRKPVTYGKTKLPVPSIVGCFSSEDNFVQPPKTLVPAAYVPVVSAHTLKDMEQVLQETNPPHNIFDAPPPKRACLQPAAKRLRVNQVSRRGPWYTGESTLPCATYVFVLCLCDSQVDDILAGRCRAFEWDRALRRRSEEFSFCKKDGYVVIAASTGRPKVTRPPGRMHVVF